MKRFFAKKQVMSIVAAAVISLTAFINPVMEATGALPNMPNHIENFADGSDLTQKPGIFVGASFDHRSSLIVKDESGVRQKIALKITPGQVGGQDRFNPQDLKIVAIDFPNGIRLVGTNTYVEFNAKGEGAYSILVPGNVQEGKYPVTYTFEYRGTKIKVTETLDVLDLGTSQQTSDLRIGEIQIPSSVYVENIFDLSFVVANVGFANAQNVEIALELPEGLVNMSQRNFVIPNLYPGQSTTYSVKLKANAEMENKFHNIKITATPTGGSDASNPAARPGNPAAVYTGTLVMGGNGGKPGKSGKPLVIMDSYEFTLENGEKTQIVKAGENVVLDFKLKNTSPKALRNIKLTFASEGGVLVPNNASNTFYEPVVGAGGYIFETLPLTVLASAEQKATLCTIGLYYEFGDGEAIEATETFTVNVAQNTKLDIVEQKSPNFEPVVEVGTSTVKSFNLINLGKTVLSNLRMSIEGEGLQSENPIVFVGNMAPGASQTVDAYYSFTESGKKEYKITFVFEDAYGKEIKEERKFIAEVMEPMPLPTAFDELPNQQDGSGIASLLKWVVGFALLVSLVVAVYFLKRSKKKKHARLEMDD